MTNEWIVFAAMLFVVEKVAIYGYHGLRYLYFGLTKVFHGVYLVFTADAD